ncbi:MAG: prolyl oligopeptidase family serine peptidase [Candidatus Sulfotelmatobacter sp.]
MRILRTVAAFVILLSCAVAVLAQSKPKLTLDDFFNSVSFRSLELSPDGNSVVVATERADWDQQIFRTDLWLYRDDSKALIQLTQSGHDSDPKWSPDGKWIAFLSERKPASGKSDDSDADSDSKNDVSQIYLISPNGGEAFPITQGEEDVHTFSWSADSQAIFYATRQPWSKTQKDDYKQQWKDVVQYRTAERGDTIFALDVAAALSRNASEPAKVEKKEGAPEKQPDLTPGARTIATMPLRVDDLVTSPDGSKLAFITNAINQRQEKYEDVEIYVVDPKGGQPRRITNNQAVEGHPHWAVDDRHLFFSSEGDVFGAYRDLQPHLYWVDTDDGKVEQWSKDFIGPVEHYAVEDAGYFVRHGSRLPVLASARIGTEVQLYIVSNPSDPLLKLSNWPGTYSTLSTATHSPKVAFVYSNLGKPEEIYLADSTGKLNDARPITSFNSKLAAADLPQGKPYQWKSDDGTTVEGMLIYPPGKFEAKHLPMFTLIHGGPADADGNNFSADWYDWAGLAATNGWLVFRPNYRGSTGYGDKFLMEIVPQIVSLPGKDILAGVDALVKDGVADPDHLTIGGYSYGGYMTNWLITQTTRFKAAVTGAGAVEHIGNWGNDDTTYDDAYFLGGRPWEAAQRYHDEAAIFQIDKVKTPTHMVAGGSDIRVAVLEDYLLEHALYSLGIPNALLVFPGEGHGLGKNPWHGKIKVREELKWLEKYGGVPAGN